ncbi:MAG: right-handed parallel beta-helix repeat-containing protein [Proteobacteria bacterium]|nr:right-handed parallel beta-helix repeat-containing protein [Pseudomonadota bacterium]
MQTSHRRREAFAQASALTLVLWLSSPLTAANTVYPTGTSPNDVVAVQAAVNAGGEVLLEAVNAAGTPTAFNFGPGEQVSITTDVAIRGETTKVGMTTIQGGRDVFVARGLSSQIRIQGIHFDHPNTAIVITATRGAVITGNWITNFSSAAVSVVNFANPSAISGVVTISDNVADSGDPFADGLAVFSASATVEVTGNEVYNVGELGIVAIPTSPISISGNLVAPGRGDDVNTFGDGILVFPGFPSDDTVLIEHNVIAPADSQAQGISVSVGRPTSIIQNQLSTQAAVAGVVLFGNVSGAYVGQNRFDGAMAIAIAIADTGQGDAVGNALIGNNVSHAQATIASLFLDQNTRDSVVTGSAGATVVDLGANNYITGAGSVGHANIGQLVRAPKQTLQAVRAKYQ